MFLNTPGPARVLSKRKRSVSLTNLSALIHLAPSLVRITASLTRLSATASRLVPFQVVLHVTARGSGFYHKRQIRLLLPRPSHTASHSTRGGIQTPRRGLAPAVPSPRPAGLGQAPTVPAILLTLVWDIVPTSLPGQLVVALS